MKACEGKLGRVFLVRLEDGDVLPGCIDRFAEEQGIMAGHVILVGGIKNGEVVVGPRGNEQMPPEPMLLPVDGVHEIAGVGVIAPGNDGKPHVHMHAALGRSGNTVAGCVRPGVTVWLVGEVVIYEIVGARVARVKDEKSGFELLDPGCGN